MRTSILAISILGAILCPTLAAPTNGVARRSGDSHINHRRSSGGAGGAGGNKDVVVRRSLPGLGFGQDLSARDYGSSRENDRRAWPIAPREFWKKAVDSPSHMVKRMDDAGTKGGNAHSGSSGAVNGGSVYNSDPTNNQGMPVLMNVNSNNAGLGGQSTSGCAASGKSGATGTGGNASSGNSGTAVGGNVDGPPSGVVNMNSNNAGTAGQSVTGCATGGDTVDSEKGAVPQGEKEDIVTSPFSNEQ